MTLKTPSKYPLEEPYYRSALRKYLDFTITDPPRSQGLRASLIKPGAIKYFDYLGDDKIVWDRSPDKKEYFKWGWIALAFDIFFITYLFLIESDGSLWWVVCTGLVFLIPVAWCFSYWKFAPNKKVIIFNRLEGTVEIPGMLWDKPHLVKFENLHAVIGASKYNTHIAVVRTRSWWDRMGPGVWIDLGWAPWEAWSLWVWYMDKNRPLPPGSAFDPYRKKDYERRKAEGFPPPLYESKIPTPEWVPGSEGSIVDNLN